jgi:hypothetical protein
MNRLTGFFTLLIFPVLIVGMVQVLRRVPLLAAILAVSPCVITFWTAVEVFLTRYSEFRIHNSEEVGTYSGGTQKRKFKTQDSSQDDSHADERHEQGLDLYA